MARLLRDFATPARPGLPWYNRERYRVPMLCAFLLGATLVAFLGGIIPAQLPPTSAVTMFYFVTSMVIYVSVMAIMFVGQFRWPKRTSDLQFRANAWVFRVGGLLLGVLAIADVVRATA